MCSQGDLVESTEVTPKEEGCADPFLFSQGQKLWPLGNIESHLSSALFGIWKDKFISNHFFSGVIPIRKRKQEGF